MTKDTNIEIGNFLRMTPEAPQYSDKNQSYLIAGANPTYYTDTPGIQEEQAAPLAAALNWVKINATLDGNVIAMIAASANAATYSAFLMTSTSQVYGITYPAGLPGGLPTGVTALGYPDGSAHVGLISGKLACVNSTVYATFTGATALYRITSFVGPTWSAGFGSVIIGPSSFLVPFLEYCIVTDGSGNVVKIDSSYVQSAGISLGAGWAIMGVKNYNSKYLAIVGVRTNSSDYTENYLFLWGGISPRYDYASRIAGAYIDMEIFDGTFKMAVAKSSTKTTMYNLRNTSLVEEVTMPYSLISQAAYSFSPQDNHSIFNYQGQVGLRLNSNADLTWPLIVFGNTPVGKEQFILSSGNLFNNFATGTDGLLYASEWNPGGVGNLWYYPPADVGSYQSILYRSHWIPVHNPSGLDVRYALPPQAGTDAINVTVFGRGQDIVTGSGIISYSLTPITPTAFLNQKRTRLDLQGFEGDFIKIVLSTVNTGAWRPIIRGVKIIQN